MPSDQPISQPARRLSSVLLRVTLLLAISLGIVSGVLQVWTDLRQEKDAVQLSAHEFLQSVAPSAASAAYNFYDDAAGRVADGLFTQRAITGVTIVNEGMEMVARAREVERTLPELGYVTQSDMVTITEPLLSPADPSGETVIGSITILVDRAIVPPAIVNRMLMYFVLATVKNTILGLLLVAVVYGALARHVIGLAETAGRWTPERGALNVPAPPKLLSGTELELLGNRIEELTKSASGRIQQAEQSNTELTEKSESLSKAIEIQNRELQRTNAQLKQMAEKDALTGLCNRRSFEERAQTIQAQALAESLELCAVLLDVDHFKAYNDYYGHQAGDECLQRVAKALNACAARHDAFVARYGGEEFVLLVASRDPKAKVHLVGDLHASIRDAAIEHERSAVSNVITVSIGCASNHTLADEEKWSVDRLISSADEALYEAKGEGRNRTKFSTPQMQQRAEEQRAARRSLMEAVQNADFVPYFQPQFDGRNGEVTGVEVLARWLRSDGSIAGPDAFFAEAVDCQFITKIDTIILERVRSSLIEMEIRGVRIPRLSLNMPKENLFSRSYMQTLIDMRNTCATPIAVELLETAVLDDASDEIAIQLDLLRDAGIEIEIDDFGTGHTSLVSLMAIKPSRLKIAKELVLPMLDSQEHHKLATSAVELGATLGIGVIAEGVENADLADELLNLGCHLQQGYHYARPMPAEDLLDYFASSEVTFAASAA